MSEMPQHRATSSGFSLSSPAFRAYIYNVAITVAVLLAAYGVIQGDKLDLFNALFAAVFGIARVNTNVADR